MLGLSRMEMDLGTMLYLRWKELKIKSPSSESPTTATTHRLAFRRLFWKGFRGLQECVTYEISQSHVVTIPEQLVEFRVDFLYREHSWVI